MPDDLPALDRLPELDRLDRLQDTPLHYLAPAALVRRRGVQRRGRARAALAGAAAAVLVTGATTAVALSGSTQEALQPAGPALSAPAPAPTPSSLPTSPALPAATAAPSPAPAPSRAASPAPSRPGPSQSSVPTPSRPAASPSAPAFPPALAGGSHGGTAWAVYLDVARDHQDPGLAEAERQVEALGYRAGPGDVGCDQGAAEALGLDPDVSYAGVAVYFATQAQAQQFVDAYAPGVVGTARVVTYCLD